MYIFNDATIISLKPTCTYFGLEIMSTVQLYNWYNCIIKCTTNSFKSLSTLRIYILRDHDTCSQPLYKIMQLVRHSKLFELHGLNVKATDRLIRYISLYNESMDNYTCSHVMACTLFHLIKFGFLTVF